MIDADVHEAIRAYTSARMYSAATTERWLHLDTSDGAALLELATALRLGENQLRDLWEWAEEIAARDGIGVHEVLAADSIAAARRRAAGRNDTLKAVKAALRGLRFPQLAAAELRLAALLAALQLPHSVRVSLPAHLEGDQVCIEIAVGSVATWRAAASALLAAADHPACAEIFAVLDEAP